MSTDAFMSTVLRVILASSVVITVAGCGPNRASTISTANVAGPLERLRVLNSLDERVARVAYRLSVASRALCPTLHPSAGWALHAATQYSAELRPHAESAFGLDGDFPGVLIAPEGSPAAAAGLQSGDLIVKVGPVELERGEERDAPSFDGLAQNILIIDEALAQGAVVLTLRRSGRLIEAPIKPRPACGYEVQLNPSDDLNARADGRRLFISTALARFAESDDELAVILGHELAHHVLGHREWDDAGGAGRSRNAAVEAVEGGSGGKERQADRVGLYLMARSGYDPSVASPFWRRFGASNWRVRYPQLEHASAETRARRLEEVRAEIDAKRAAGQPLLP